MATWRAVVLSAAAGSAGMGAWTAAAQGDVEPHVPTELPGPGWPGPSAEESQGLWPSGHQPGRHEAWPQRRGAGTGQRTLLPCWKTAVLADHGQGWPGSCLELFQAKGVSSASACEALCLAEPRCPVWQFVNQTSPGQCWVGNGKSCVGRGGSLNTITVQGAQRIMHGDVRVLQNMSGWKIQGLFQLGELTPERGAGEEGSAERCRRWCYSDIGCQYWQYGPGGCWVDAPLFTTARGTDPDNRVQYPLTTNGGCTNTTSEAAAMMWGEYIQHYCPPEEAPQAEEDKPKITLGAAVNAQPAQDGVLGMPTWVMVAILLALAACVVLCVYTMSQQGAGRSGSKREASKTSRSMRGMQMSAEYQEDLAMDSMVESSPNARSLTPSEYSDGAMDGIPPPPAWEPLATAAAMPPGPGYGGQDVQASQASWWHGGQHGGQHYPHHFAPTQRLDAMPPPPNPYDQGARGAQPPGVPFPTGAPPGAPTYNGQSAPQYYGHYPHPSAQQPRRWF